MRPPRSPRLVSGSCIGSHGIDHPARSCPDMPRSALSCRLLFEVRPDPHAACAATPVRLDLAAHRTVGDHGVHGAADRGPTLRW